MKEIFNFKRFGKFFLYDLRNSKNNYWLSLLICAAMPLIIFAIAQTFSRLFCGTWIYNGLLIQVCSAIMAMIVVLFTYPVKAYGKITDKRAGSAWVMLPASPLEKTLSIILTSCVVLPLVFFGLLFGVDALMGVIFPKMWSEPLASLIWNLGPTIEDQSEGIVLMNFPGALWYSWTSNVLTFILGSIFFKKAKIGKTFLALFLLGQAISIVCSLVLIGTPAFADILNADVNAFEDPSFAFRMLKNFNWFMGIYLWGYLVIIIGLLWARVKTIKH